MDEIYETQETALATTDGATLSFTDSILVEAKEAGYFSTFKVETMEDKKRLYSARNSNELLRDHMGEVINAVDFVIDSQTINDTEYGAKIVPCLHIIDKDGVAYQSASSGVVKTACDILSTFGMPDTWGGALPIVCKETTTNNGFRYKYLDVTD